MTITRTFDFAHHALENHPRQNCLADKHNGEWLLTSTLQLCTQANKISRGLLKLGINPGDKIALISHNNRSEWGVMDLACAQIGVITVPVYPTISAEDYVYIFNHAQVKFCFVSNKQLYDKIDKIHGQIEHLSGIFTFDDCHAPNWNEVMDLGEDEHTQGEVEDLMRSIKEDDLATIIYTSGTTGTPKGVMLSHQNIVSNVLASGPRIPKGPDKNPKALSFLPICHIFERMIYLLYLHNNIGIYFAESLETIGENVKEVQPHYMTVVPRLVEKVFAKIHQKGTEAGGLKAKIFNWALNLIETYEIGQPKSLKHFIADKLVFSKWREGLGGNMICLVCGSAALSPRLNRLFHGAGIPIQEGYGLTETSPVIAVNSRGCTRFGSVGHILDNLNVKIASDGEILVKGPSVMMAYYNNPDESKACFDEQGFFKTGDIGHIDDDGYLFITDRKKEMFKTSGGKYIAPQVIENKMKSSKFIDQIMVIGEGQKMPCAIIQPDFIYIQEWAKAQGLQLGNQPESIIQSPELLKAIRADIDAVNSTLGAWEQVKMFELSTETWSVENGLLTPTMKLKRKVILKKFEHLYQKMYS
jgi:long-chain acyl-CoA synthetase